MKKSTQSRFKGKKQIKIPNMKREILTWFDEHEINLVNMLTCGMHLVEISKAHLDSSEKLLAAKGLRNNILEILTDNGRLREGEAAVFSGAVLSDELVDQIVSVIIEAARNPAIFQVAKGLCGCVGL